MRAGNYYFIKHASLQIAFHVMILKVETNFLFNII